MQSEYAGIVKWNKANPLLLSRNYCPSDQTRCDVTHLVVGEVSRLVLFCLTLGGARGTTERVPLKAEICFTRDKSFS